MGGRFFLLSFLSAWMREGSGSGKRHLRHKKEILYRVFSEFLYTFKFAAISLIKILSPKHRREKICARQK